MKIQSTLIAVLMSGAAALQAAPAFAADAPAPDSANQVQEVVVTANKRQESLQDVPVAVTALSAQKAR